MAKRQSSIYSVSQNFLTDRKLIKKAGLNDQDTVLEIGAGKGHITKELSLSCRTVIAYEIDGKLYEKLKPQLDPNVQLHHADFLKCALPKFPYKVFANIPFSRTTAILNKLTQADNLPSGMWLVMEKGAAMRFLGMPRESLHSLQLKPFYECRILYRFRREDFHPAPHVDVVMLELRRKEKQDILPAQRRAFAAFLSRGLKDGFYGPHAPLTKKQIAAALRAAHLPPLETSGEVLYVQWLCLFRCWFGYRRGPA